MPWRCGSAMAPPIAACPQACCACCARCACCPDIYLLSFLDRWPRGQVSADGPSGLARRSCCGAYCVARPASAGCGGVGSVGHPLVVLIGYHT